MASRYLPQQHLVGPGLYPYYRQALVMVVFWVVLPITLFGGAEFGRTPVTFVAAPIWAQVYWPLVISLTAGIGVSLVDLIRPWRPLAVSIADSAINVFSGLVIGTLLRANHYVDVLGDPANADQVTRATRFFNQPISVSLTVVAAVLAFDILYELWKITSARTRTTVRVV